MGTTRELSVDMVLLYISKAVPQDVGKVQKLMRTSPEMDVMNLTFLISSHSKF